MSKFIVSLQGSGVYRDHFNMMLVDDTSDETLERIRKILLKRYDLEICGFTERGAGLHAFTCNDDIHVFIEEIYTIDWWDY